MKTNPTVGRRQLFCSVFFFFSGKEVYILVIIFETDNTFMLDEANAISICVLTLNQKNHKNMPCAH